MRFSLISGDRSEPCPCDCADTGVIYCNASIEPYAATTLLNTSCNKGIVAVWEQGRWSDASGNAIIAGYSRDFGKTWAQAPLPFTRCIKDGLPYTRAALAWVSMGIDGIIYVTAVGTNVGSANAVVVSSKSAGKCWSNQQVLQEAPIEPNFPNVSNYTVSVTADPTRPKTAYTIWGGATFSQNSSDTFLSRTIDGGQTWSSPQNIYSSTTGVIGYDQSIISPVTGTMFHFFAEGGLLDTNIYYYLQRSTDQGKTWSNPPILIAKTTRVSGIPFYSQAFGGIDIRAGYVGLQAAINPVTNQLAVVFNQCANNTTSPIAITFSNNDGHRWSDPIPVSDSDTPTFNSSVSYLSSGSTIGVSYYRVKQPTSENALPVQYVFRYSTNQGATFSEEINVGPVFNLLTAPYSDGFYLGNYQKLLAVDNHFQGFFAATHCNPKSTKILTAPIYTPSSCPFT